MEKADDPAMLPVETRIMILGWLMQDFRTKNIVTDTDVTRYLFYRSKRPKLGDIICRWNIITKSKGSSYYIANEKDVDNYLNLEFLIIRLSQFHLVQKSMTTNTVRDAALDMHKRNEPEAGHTKRTFSSGNETITRFEVNPSHRRITMTLLNTTMDFNIIHNRINLPIISTGTDSEVVEDTEANPPHKRLAVKNVPMLNMYKYVVNMLADKDMVILVHDKVVYKVPAIWLKSAVKESNPKDATIAAECSLSATKLYEYEFIPF